MDVGLPSQVVRFSPSRFGGYPCLCVLIGGKSCRTVGLGPIRKTTPDLQAAVLQQQKDWRQQKQMGPLRRSLAQLWEDRHPLYDQQRASKISDGTTQSRCLKYGFCLCTGQGLLAYLFQKSMAAHLLPRCVTRSPAAKGQPKPKAKPPKTRARVLLESSQLCARLVASATVAQYAEHSGDSCGWGCEYDEGLPVPDDLWFHINYVNFREMNFSCLKLLMDPSKQKPGPTVLLEVPPGRVPVYRSCRMFAEMQLKFAWKAVWYRIVSDSQRLDDEWFLPRYVEVQELDQAVLPELRLWQGSDKELEKDEQKRKSREKRATTGTRAQRRGKQPKTGSGTVDGAPLQPASDLLEDVIEDLGWGDAEAQNVYANLDLQPDHEGTTGGAIDAREWEPWQLLAEVSDALTTRDEPARPAEAARPPATPSASAVQSSESMAAHGEAVPVTSSSSAPKKRAAPAPAAAGRKKTVVEDMLQVRIDGRNYGSIRYNPRFQTFTAHCEHKTHTDCGSCRKQRSALAGSKAKAGQGRPLGYLTAWLLAAEDFPDNSTHVHEFHGAPLDHRIEARRKLMLLPGSEAFASYERAREPGEEVEPRSIQ